MFNTAHYGIYWQQHYFSVCNTFSSKPQAMANLLQALYKSWNPTRICVTVVRISTTILWLIPSNFTRYTDSPSQLVMSTIATTEISNVPPTKVVRYVSFCSRALIRACCIQMRNWFCSSRDTTRTVLISMELQRLSCIRKLEIRTEICWQLWEFV
jgi:hypothetical protein